MSPQLTNDTLYLVYFIYVQYSPQTRKYYYSHSVSEFEYHFFSFCPLRLYFCWFTFGFSLRHSFNLFFTYINFFCFFLIFSSYSICKTSFRDVSNNTVFFLTSANCISFSWYHLCPPRKWSNLWWRLTFDDFFVD